MAQPVSDVCPVCGDGILRITSAKGVEADTWTAQCDTCDSVVALDDTLEYVRDYELSPAWLLLVVFCFLLAALVEVPT